VIEGVETVPPDELVQASTNGHKPQPDWAAAQFWRRTNEGLAIELLKRYRDHLRYVNDLARDLKPDNFATWVGNHWAFKAAAVAAIGEWQRKMTSEFREYTKTLLDEAGGLVDALDKSEKEALKFGQAIESHGFKSAWKDEMKTFPDIHIALKDFDSDPLLFNCLNGTIDLRTGELRPHRREDLITKIVGLNYSKDAKCETWLRFLSEIFNGDEKLVAYIKRAIGYSLTADTREQCFFLCHGEGRNGKSTMLKVLREYVLGDYAAMAVMKTFILKRNDPAINNDLALLNGRRFVTAVETNEGQSLDEAMVKAVTGEGAIQTRFLNQEFFEMKPVFKLWFAMNHEPKIRGTDPGIWRRVNKIPFLVDFTGREDKELDKKLQGEAEGILAWAVEGCLEWLRDGLQTPDKVLAATAKYRAEQDVLGQFIADVCVVGPDYRVEAKELFALYCKWCEETRTTQLSMGLFRRKLTDRRFEPKESNGKSFRLGLGIRAEGVNQPAEEDPQGDLDRAEPGDLPF
jgi:putative DNA primase/helicase